MAKDVPQHWKEFEEEGEEPTRKKFYQGLFGSPGSTKHIAAKGFLKHKQEERERRDAHQAIQREETRDAFARGMGLAALVVSIISLAIALLAFLK